MLIRGTIRYNTIQYKENFWCAAYSRPRAHYVVRSQFNSEAQTAGQASVDSRFFNPLTATLTAEQRTVIEQYSDWYTGR